MMLLGDSLAARIVAILLGGVMALALLVGAAVMWPKDGGDSEGLFQLPVPRETAAIVEALEASPPTVRPLVLRAVNTRVASAHLEADFPPIPRGLRRAREMEWMFGSYNRVLGGRQFRVEMRTGPFSNFALWRGDPARASIRLSVRLKDGSVLVLERRPSALMRSYIARLSAVTGAAVLILISGLLLAIRQTAQPVSRLALAARRFSIDGEAADLPLTGPRELRDLSAAFNDMQHRISSLVQDRTRALAAIAHDLRTYLTRLRLRADFITDADQRERAERDIDEMAQLIDDTLLFAEQSAQNAGALQTLDARAELEAFVAARMELCEPVTLEANGLVGAIAVRCSPLAFRRILANLVDNAIRYGGSARLSLRRAADNVELIVEDDGPGVPTEALVGLTKPFERLEPSRARVTGGAGLGLSIVKSLAEGFGGNLVLQNRTPHGLRATVRLRVG